MEKLELMRNVLMTISCKEKIKGNMCFKISKCEEKILDVNADFEDELASEYKKVKMSTMIDLEKTF